MFSLSIENSTNVRLGEFLTPPRAPRPADEAALLATARPLLLQAAGHELRAWSWGHRGDRTVLLVHGWGGRGGQLGAHVPGLVAQGRRVVTFDAPAHGDSTAARTTLAALAETVRGVARRLGGVDAVIAHSFGAAATTVALSRGLEVARVAYVAPLFSVVDSVARYIAHLGLSPADADAFRRALSAANLAGPDELDGASLAPRMTAPLLVVHDRDDREVPYTDGVAAAAVWSGARLVTTTGLGHRRILSDPAVVSEVREFVAGPDETAMIDRDLWDREARRARAFP
jgi:pimeloyl-ACP methyl ester carboxylesterase